MAAIQVPIIAVYALPEGRRLAMKQALWRRAEEFFHAALERSPEAGQAFLDEACGEDTELRRQGGMIVSKDEHAGKFPGEAGICGCHGHARHTRFAGGRRIRDSSSR